MLAALLAAQMLAAMPDAAHLRAMAESAGAPPLAVLAVAYTESRNSLRPSLRGPGGEWGRFQIKLATARRRCPGFDVRTYDGNVRCFFKMFAEDMKDGTVAAITRHNGSGPEARKYADRVLALWKREEIYQGTGLARKPADASCVGPTTTRVPAPTDGTSTRRPLPGGFCITSGASCATCHGRKL